MFFCSFFLKFGWGAVRASGRRCSSIRWDWKRSRSKGRTVRAKANPETAVECWWLKLKTRLQCHRRRARIRPAANGRSTTVRVEFHLEPDRPIPGRLLRKMEVVWPLPPRRRRLRLLRVSGAKFRIWITQSSAPMASTRDCRPNWNPSKPRWTRLMQRYAPFRNARRKWKPGNN